MIKDKKETIENQVIKLSKFVNKLSNDIITLSEVFTENKTILINIKETLSNFNNIIKSINQDKKQKETSESNVNKLYTDINNLRNKTKIITIMNKQLIELEKKVDIIVKNQNNLDITEITQNMKNYTNSVKNNSYMITKIARRIDELESNVKTIRKKINTISNIEIELNDIKNNTQKFMKDINDNSTRNTTKLKNTIQKIIKKTEEISTIHIELNKLKKQCDEIDNKTHDIKSLNNKVSQLKNELDKITINIIPLSNINQKIQQIQNQISSAEKKSRLKISKDAVVENNISNLKNDVNNKISKIGKNITDISNKIEKSNAEIKKFHNNTTKITQELNNIKSKNIMSTEETKELLRLTKYQSKIKMCIKLDHGDINDLKEIISCILEITKIFNNLIKKHNQIEVPYEIIQWAINIIFECAYRWEIKFINIFRLLVTQIDHKILSDNIGIEQIRDNFGIRAVDHIRKELNMN